MPKRPWTPYAVLCSAELRFCRLCNFDLPNKQRFSLQRHKSTRIRLVPNSWIVMPVFCGTELRFGSLCNLGLSKKLRFSLQRHKTREFGEAEFSDCLPVSSFASENSCFRNSHEQKLQNSAKPNSGTVRRFSPLIPAVWGFGLGLLGGQGFIGAKASLAPLCRALWHRASLLPSLQLWFAK